MIIEEGILAVIWFAVALAGILIFGGLFVATVCGVAACP